MTDKKNMRKDQIKLIEKMIVSYWQYTNIYENQKDWFVSQEIIKQLRVATNFNTRTNDE